MSKTENNHVLLALAMKAAEGMQDKEKPMNPPLTWGTPVTVIVHGVIIAGVVISREKYMAEVVKDMREAKLTTDDQTNRMVWNSITNVTEELLAKTETSGAYLYLGDAKVMSETIGPMIHNVFWCIRLADVSAFMIGHPAQ